MSLILFSGCSYYTTYDFCNERISEFSNATKITKSISSQEGFVGCSDGYNIAWYPASDYEIAKSLNHTGKMPEHLRIPLYEVDS